jgi:superfamily II DNA/RNA helicase
MAPEITRITEAFLHNPVRVEIAHAASTTPDIRQALVASEPGAAKRETLRRLIRSSGNLKNAIIFSNRKRDVALLAKSLERHGFSVGALHGDMDQRARMASLEAFRNGEVAFLVCSDVAARGLDIPEVSHVFNFDVPTHPEDYVHRIGRTGRAGRSGTALSLVTPLDRKHVDDIERLIDRKIDWMGPSVDEKPEAAVESEATHQRRGPSSRSQRGRSENGGADRRAERAALTQRHSAQPKPTSRRPEGRRPHHEEDETVVGLGDHVPSFLLRPVRLPS